VRLLPDRPFLQDQRRRDPAARRADLAQLYLRQRAEDRRARIHLHHQRRLLPAQRPPRQPERHRQLGRHLARIAALQRLRRRASIQLWQYSHG
jgi:hypothetical protein